MNSYLIKNATIVNEGATFLGDLLIENGFIKKIASSITATNTTIIDARGKHLIPGLIDDQVHFREPGLTHKATIATESKAAVAGGITTFIEMPNTIPKLLLKNYWRISLLLRKKHLMQITLLCLVAPMTIWKNFYKPIQKQWLVLNCF